MRLECKPLAVAASLRSGPLARSSRQARRAAARHSRRHSRPLAIQRLEPKIALTVAPTLVADINTVPFGSSPSEFTVVGDVAYFKAFDPADGPGAFGNRPASLWKSDGTTAGTMRVSPAGLEVYGGLGLAAVGETLYFSADDGVHGRELWKTDGTPEGTVLVADVVAGSGSSNPVSLTAVGATLFFSATDGVQGDELWKSDGTADGTVLVADINPGSYGGSYGWSSPKSSMPSSLTAVGETLYFLADDGVHGRELWKSDGTAEGTVLVKDIREGSVPYSYGGSERPASSYVSSLTAVGETLFFTADDGVHGFELWKSDGTAEGTVLVKDIVEGSFVSPDGSERGFSSFPSSLTALGSALFFSADDWIHGRELWTSDGTAEGTVLVADLAPGTVPMYGEDFPASSNPTGLTAVGEELFFLANGTRLWKSDGTAGGTTQVGAIGAPDDEVSGSGSYGAMALLGGTLLFAADDGATGAEPWAADIASGETRLVKDIDPRNGGSFASSYGGSASYGAGAVFNGLVYFAATDGETGTELWRTDGTAEGTVLVKDIAEGFGLSGGPYSYGSFGPLGSSPANFTVAGGLLFFTARTPDTGVELWKTDGTTDGTVLVADLSPGSSGSYYGPPTANSSWPGSLTAVGDMLYFSAEDGLVGRRLWRTDGEMIEAVEALAGFVPVEMAAVGTSLYVVAYPALGGETGFFELDTLTDGLTPADFDGPVGSLAAGLGTLFFFDGLLREFDIDGATVTGFGGYTLSDPLLGVAGGFAQLGVFQATGFVKPVERDGRLYFTASRSAHGVELWTTDGTAAGTQLVRDIYPGVFDDGFVTYPASSNPFSLTVAGGAVYFLATDADGLGVWQTDGSEANTLKLLSADGPPTIKGLLAGLDDRLFLVADDGLVGRELWALLAEDLVDETPPTVAITDDVPGTATGPLTFTFTFSEPVSGFTADAVVVANGTKAAFTAVSATIYTLVVTPSADTVGTLTVSLNPGAGIDGAGNESLGTSVTQPFDTTPDATPPTVLITDDVPGTATGPFTFTFTFDEPVIGFTGADIAVTEGTPGTFTVVNQQVYRLVVAPAAPAVGVVSVTLAAGGVSDWAGNPNPTATATQPYDTNSLPVIVSGATAAVAEGQPLVLAVVAEDPDAGQTLVYAVAGGPDAALFSFAGSGLLLQPFAGPSFASPADAGADNVYEVTIAVGDGLATVTQDVRITVLPPTGNLAVTELGDVSAAAVLARALVGDGVTISNISFTGTGRSAGFFSGGLAAGLGLPQGIVLSSGLVTNAIGPNTEDGTSYSLGTAGDADLDGLIPGFTTRDATVLEFDFLVAESALSFQYVFASEEYNEYVGSSFNDVFGFFVDGVNIALLPGTTTPVAINNVNTGLNEVFYRNNDPSDLGQPTPFATAADGFTSVLQASVTLQPGTHRIKLAIADAGDTILDSWVFLSTQSFVSGFGDLQITAGELPAGLAPGSQVTVSYTVTNAGEEPVTGAVFQAAVPPGFGFVSATTTAGDLSQAGGVVSVSLGELPAGASVAIDVVLTAPTTADAFGGGSFTGFVQADQIDLTPANNAATVVLAANLPPSITSPAVVTLEERRADVVEVTATDPNPGTTFVFSIAGGADAALFSFAGATLRLLPPAGPSAASPADADGDGIYEVTIRVGDGLAFTEQNVLVTIIADTVPPSVAITDDVPGTATGPVTFTFTFSESVTGFTADDVVVSNGTKGAFTAVSGSIYTLVVTPLAASTTSVAILVPDNAAQDLAGNPSTANVTSQPVDTVAPTVAMTDDAPGMATGPVTFTFTFSEPVVGFTAGDVSVTNGTKGVFTAVSETVFTLVVTPSPAATGPLTVSLAAGAASDAAGNPSAAAAVSQEVPVRAVIGAAVPAGSLTEDAGLDPAGFLVATGSFTVVDPNPGEAAFKTVVTVPTGVTNLGTLEVAEAGAFTYRVQNSLDAVQALRAGETRTEVFTIESLDGTKLDVTFSIAGVADLLAGVVADGYLAGATVFADANGNGVLDAGELSTTTDSAGNFSFDFGSLTATLITVGGTDISTGLPFAGSLTAPAGSAVINPLTTLVTAVVAAGPAPADSAALAAAVAAASSQVVTGLGLPAVSLTTFDPLAAGADAQTALAVQKAAASVANVIVVAGTVGGSPAAMVTNLAAAVTAVPAGQTVNLGDPALLAQVMTTGQTPPPTAAVAGVAQANAQIATAATIGAVAELQTVVQSASAFVEENTAASTVVFQAATPAGMTAPAFSLKDVAGDDKALVSIDGATGAVRLLAPANFEAKASYRFTVVASQEGQATVETAITIAVTDVNEPPTDIALSAAAIAENSALGTVIGTFTTTDPDADDTFTYALVAGEGDADNAAFTIEGGELRVATGLNFERQSGYSIRVQATDAGGLSTEKVFTITVTDVADEPLVIEGVTPPAAGVYRAGQTLFVTVSLSEVVQVRGKPQLQVRAGSVTRTATYVSGSGTPVLTFSYRVGPQDNAPAVSLGQRFVFPKGASIAAGSERLAAALPAGVAGGVAPGVRLDSRPPRVSGPVRVPGAGTYVVGQPLDFVVRFTEPVIVSGEPRIQLLGLTGVRQATYVSGSGTTELTFRYVVQAGDAVRRNQALRLAASIALPGGASIVDEAGNRGVLGITAGSMKRVRIDGTAVAAAGESTEISPAARAAAFATLG